MLKHLMMILIMPLPPRLPPQSSRPSAPPALTVARVPATSGRLCSGNGHLVGPAALAAARPPATLALPAARAAATPSPSGTAGKALRPDGPGLGPRRQQGRPWVEPEAEPACGQGEDRAEGSARSLPVRS